MSSADEVLAFWYEELKPKDWWNGTPATDTRIRERFEPLYRAWRADPPPSASLDGRGHLAVVLVLDQFPRNLFRGSAEAFATDPVARRYTLDAVDRGLDTTLTVPERHFLYMPLMHSEDPEDQLRSIALYTALGSKDALPSAEAHRRTIDRFGRFPYRNAALGRESTAEEKAFLVDHPGPS